MRDLKVRPERPEERWRRGREGRGVERTIDVNDCRTIY